MYMKHLTFASLLLLAIHSAATPRSLPSTASPEYNGSITLYLDDNGDGKERVNCIIPVATRKFNLDGEEDDDPECNNNDTHYFKLENVPSATTFEIYNDRDCEDQTDEMYFKFKTIINPTHMTSRVSIERAASTSPGNVIVPGIKLLESNMRNINDDISCIKMELSPKP